MALSIDQIIEKFNYKSFPVIDSKPDYQSIHNMWTLLYGNNSTLTNNMVEGNHRHIVIVMRDTLYAKISPMPYDAPVDPGVTAKIPLQEKTT